MKQKTVLVFPGTYWQIPIIQKCKSMGIRVLVVHPNADSPALPYADGYLLSDIFDTERVVPYCISEHIDAVISEECDIAMPQVALLGERLHLSTLNPESAYLFTNKFAMRNLCKKLRLPFPAYQLCRSVEEAESFFDELQTPMIIKPLDANSSKGVYTIKHRTEIKNLFEKTMVFNRSEKIVLAERYINGTEFTVDGIKTPNRHYTLAISEKKHFPYNQNIAQQLYFSSENERYDYLTLRKTNDYLIEHSPLTFGLTHAEYKYENGSFYLIEMAARGGGNLISSHIVPYLSGVDNYEYLIQCALGNISNCDFTVPDKYTKRCAVLRFFEAPKGGVIVQQIQGVDILRNDPHILAYQFNFKPGDIISDASTDAERIGFYIACAESKEALDMVIDNIAANVVIECAKDG